MPETIRTIAYCFPLSHAVEIARTVLHKDLNSSLILHFAVLLAYGLGLSFLSLKVFNKRLSQ